MARRSIIHPYDPVARRLWFSRVALGFREQKPYAKGAGIAPNTYNEYEKAKRPLTLETVVRLGRKYGLPKEWLLDGVPDRLPHAFVLKLEALGAFDAVPAAKNGYDSAPAQK